jgi:hypothetical protein
LAGFIEAINIESSKPGLAPSNAFVLVEWCSALLQELSDTIYWDRWGLNILTCNAHILELCLRGFSRPDVKRSALVVTWRGLRKVFSNGNTRQKLIEDAVKKLSSKGSQPSAINSIMLGAIAGVCARKPVAKQILITLKPSFYGFYNREIVGSRSPIPQHIANGLNEFFLKFSSLEDIEQEIIPSLEKALLRAPEVVHNDLLTPLFHSIPDSIDISTIIRVKILKPLLSNIKSTNATIRCGALSAFKVAVTKCHDVDAVVQIAEEILFPLKSGKLPSADQRAYHADMLAALPISEKMVSKLPFALATVAGKETNETALNAETLALLHCLEWATVNGMPLEKPVVDILVKGMSDKKIPLRRLWTIRFGELLWTTSDSAILEAKLSVLAESSMPALVDIWKESTSNPIAAAQSGLITAAYIFTALAGSRLAVVANMKVDAALKKAQIASQVLVMDPKPSFLLNQRIYGKLSTDNDFIWFLRALSSVSKDLITLEPDSAVALGWAQAMMFCICSASINPELRKQASKTLSRIYMRSPQHISKLIIAGLWRWTHAVETGDKDSAAAVAKTENNNLHIVVRSICLPPSDAPQFYGEVSKSIIQEQLVSLLVLSRPELLPRINWIDLCLRVGIDPGELAQLSGESLMQQILDVTTYRESVRYQNSSTRILFR